jgi:cardiolipin synthase A/B
VRFASRYHYGVLLEAGVGIYEYRPTMMHNKVMVVDGIWSTVGSINFVNRSMTKNAEVNVAVYDKGFAVEVEKMVLADLARCDVLTESEWKERGLFTRTGELFFFLFSENY